MSRIFFCLCAYVLVAVVLVTYMSGCANRAARMPDKYMNYTISQAPPGTYYLSIQAVYVDADQTLHLDGHYEALRKPPKREENYLTVYKSSTKECFVVIHGNLTFKQGIWRGNRLAGYLPVRKVLVDDEALALVKNWH